MAYDPNTGKGLGRLYDANHRAFRFREWKGLGDTMYEYGRWLKLYGFMAVQLGPKAPQLIKAMLRYRWLPSYLTAAGMMDRHTIGQRGKELRYSHEQFFSVLHHSVVKIKEIVERDANVNGGSARAAALRDKTVMFDEMTPSLIMMGFPTLDWVDIAMYAVGMPSEVDQNSCTYYIDAIERFGLAVPVLDDAVHVRGNHRFVHAIQQLGLQPQVRLGALAFGHVARGTVQFEPAGPFVGPEAADGFGLDDGPVRARERDFQGEKRVRRAPSGRR